MRGAAEFEDEVDEVAALNEAASKETSVTTRRRRTLPFLRGILYRHLTCEAFTCSDCAT